MASVKELEINSTVYDVKGKTVVDNNSGELSFWSGTKAQYDAIQNKDSKCLYSINDDTDVSLTILEALYPVGSVYITTNDTCPLSTLITGSTWVQETCRQLVEKKEPTDDDPSWYNLYSDGWCEQGSTYVGTTEAIVEVPLLKSYKDTNYQVFLTRNPSSDFTSDVNGRWAEITELQTGKFKTWGKYNVHPNLFWRACGYTSTTTSHKQFRRTA